MYINRLNKTIPIFLLLLIGVVFSSLAQQDTINRKDYHFISTFLLIKPWFGDIAFSYEQALNKTWSLEYTAGYIYRDLYWKDIGSLSDPEQNHNGSGLTFTPTQGFTTSFFLKQYSDEFKSFFHGPLLIYRFVHMPSVRKFYEQAADSQSASLTFSDGSEYKFEDKVCDYCITKEQIDKQVLSIQYLIGTQGHLSERILFNASIGLGTSLKIIKANIKELFDQNIRYTFTFENYPIRYYILTPSFQMGVKVGYLISK